jgi:HAD superfamily hydrolase (TIGR01549 family)
VTLKAVMLDYIGTLVEPINYTLEASETNLHKALCEAGLKTNKEQFLEAYKTAHEKQRVTRYEQLREVTNAVWVSEALNTAGCNVSQNDLRLKTGLNVFFQDFINSLQLRQDAKRLLKKASELGKVGLVSNFTYAPVIYASLRKLGLNNFFNAVVVSEQIGWRKPHKIIFDQALRALHVTAEEAVYVGDSPLEDIYGAKKAGLKVVFVSSRFYTVKDLHKCGEEADLVVENLGEACEALYKQGLNKKSL